MASAESRQAALRHELAGRRAQLPIRFWRQQAHLTAPAERDVALKALSRGTAPMTRILERLGIPASELADRLGADRVSVQELLDQPRPAPLVVVDAEDALALTDAAVRRGREDAIEVLSRPRSAGGGLRFYRPPSLELGATAREMLPVLWGIVERTGPEAFPLDGIVVPKIGQPEEVDLIHEMLDQAEASLGLTSAHDPDRLSRRVRLGREPAGRDRPARRRPALRAHLRPRRLQRGPGPACHRFRTTSRRTGRAPASSPWRRASVSRPSMA